MELHDDDIADLLPLYALDALSDDERARVEAYLAGHPEARADLAELGAAAAFLPLAADPVVPDPAVKQRLLSRVRAPAPGQAYPASARPRSTAETPKRSFWDRFWPVFGAAAAAAALFALLWGAGLRANEATLRQQIAGMEQRLAEAEAGAAAAQGNMAQLRAENEALRDQLQQQTDVLAMLREPGARSLTVGDATGGNPAAAGTLLTDAGGEGRFIAAHLQPLAAGQTYQLWLIDGETPISAGVFNVDEAGNGALDLDALPPSFNAVGVSIEPEGGSPTPTVERIVLLGTTGG